MSSPIFLVKEHFLESQYIREYARATQNSQEETLKLAIKQYIPVDNPNPKEGDITIIAAHANGYPKVIGSTHVSQTYLTLNRSCTNPSGRSCTLDPRRMASRFVVSGSPTLRKKELVVSSTSSPSEMIVSRDHLSSRLLSDATSIMV